MFAWPGWWPSFLGTASSRIGDAGRWTCLWHPLTSLILLDYHKEHARRYYEEMCRCLGCSLWDLETAFSKSGVLRANLKCDSKASRTVRGKPWLASVRTALIAMSSTCPRHLADSTGTACAGDGRRSLKFDMILNSMLFSSTSLLFLLVISHIISWLSRAPSLAGKGEIRENGFHGPRVGDYTWLDPGVRAEGSRHGAAAPV